MSASGERLNGDIGTNDAAEEHDAADVIDENRPNNSPLNLAGRPGMVNRADGSDCEISGPTNTTRSDRSVDAAGSAESYQGAVNPTDGAFGMLQQLMSNSGMQFDETMFDSDD